MRWYDIFCILFVHWGNPWAANLITLLDFELLRSISWAGPEQPFNSPWKARGQLRWRVVTKEWPHGLHLQGLESELQLCKKFETKHKPSGLGEALATNIINEYVYVQRKNVQTRIWKHATNMHKHVYEHIWQIWMKGDKPMQKQMCKFTLKGMFNTHIFSSHRKRLIAKTCADHNINTFTTRMGLATIVEICKGIHKAWMTYLKQADTLTLNWKTAS